MNNLYQVCRLDESDFKRGFLQLLEQLTVVDPDSITYEQFCEHYKNMSSDVYVIRDISSNKVVASGAIFIEKKFIHGLSSVGHIEDIVVDTEYRGYGLGKSIVDHLTKVAKESGCYKVILNCNKDNTGFYNKCGFKEKEVEMVLYFD